MPASNQNDDQLPDIMHQTKDLMIVLLDSDRSGQEVAGFSIEDRIAKAIENCEYIIRACKTEGQRKWFESALQTIVQANLEIMNKNEKEFTELVHECIRYFDSGINTPQE